MALSALYLTALSFEKSGMGLPRGMGYLCSSVSVASTENTSYRSSPKSLLKMCYYMPLKTEAFIILLGTDVSLLTLL